MSFSDPQSVTFPAPLAGTFSLPLTSRGVQGAEYTSSDGTVKLTASSQKTGKSRIRRVLRLDHSKYSASPLLPGQNVLNSMSCYIVFDIPVGGYSNAEAQAIYTGLKTQMTAASDALITKLLGGES